MNRLTQLGFVGVVVGLAVVLIVSNGSVLSDSSATPTDSPMTSSAMTTDDGGKAPHEASIDISPRGFDTSVESPNDTTMRPRIAITIRGRGSVNYENILLCAYDASGTLLQQRSLGDITTNASKDFYKIIRPNLTVQTRPQYLIVDHPRLRNDSIFSTVTRYWEGDGYGIVHQSLDEIQNQFEWPRTNQTGKCG